MPRENRRTFKPGTVFESYAIQKLIGQGGFGDVYWVKEKGTDSSFAMKLEPINGDERLQIELQVLQKLQGSPLPPKLSASGATDNHRYMVMELIGPSVAQVRRKMPGGKLSLSTSLRVAFHMLRLIQELHNTSYIHRDIKPANFLIRAEMANPITLIDYGLAKLYANPETGEILPPREKKGFVGAAKYCSTHAHEGMELSRRDDIACWIYSLIEMIKGSLPWSHLKDRHEIYMMKQSISIESLLEGLPQQLQSIWKCYEQCSFEDKPNYPLLMSFLNEAIEEAKISWTENYDWDQISAEDMKRMSVLDVKERCAGDVAFTPTDLPPPVLPGEEKESEIQAEAVGGCGGCCL
jgi:serine/threonine protein kinase